MKLRAFAMLFLTLAVSVLLLQCRLFGPNTNLKIKPKRNCWFDSVCLSATPAVCASRESKAGWGLLSVFAVEHFPLQQLMVSSCSEGIPCCDLRWLLTDVETVWTLVHRRVSPCVNYFCIVIKLNTLHLPYGLLCVHPCEGWKCGVSAFTSEMPQHLELLRLREGEIQLLWVESEILKLSNMW